VVIFTPLVALPRGKSSRYPLDRRLGGPQRRSGLDGEGGKFSASGGNQRLVVRTIAYFWNYRSLIQMDTKLCARHWLQVLHCTCTGQPNTKKNTTDFYPFCDRDSNTQYQCPSVQDRKVISGMMMMMMMTQSLRWLGYELDDRCSIPGRGKDCLLPFVTASRLYMAHPASFTMFRVGSFSGNKAAGTWSWPITWM
jgi:hypothetical protein